MEDRTRSDDHGSNESVWHVDRRTLPAPAGASKQLRESIAATPSPDPAVMPVLPDDAATLSAFVERADSMTIEMVRSLRDQLPVTVTPDVIDGVEVHRVAPARVLQAYSELNQFLLAHLE